MKTITRAKYLDRIIELNGTPDIKIITGIRRSGKSKLMQAYIAYLKNNFENINIIFIDFMDLAYEEIKEYHALHSYVEEHYQEGKTNYLFVDEVQMCPKFELAINSLYSKGKYDIYVTGSNAFLLMKTSQPLNIVRLLNFSVRCTFLSAPIYSPFTSLQIRGSIIV